MLRLVDDQVIGYDRRYFPPSIAGRFNPAFVTDRPIAQLVSEIAGSSPHTARSSEVEVEIHTAMGEVVASPISVSHSSAYLQPTD